MAPQTLKMDDTESVKNELGKREVTQANPVEPPAAKCLQLPKLPETCNISDEDAKEAKAAVETEVPKS